MYSTHNEGRSVVAERFIKILNGKINKKLTGNNIKSYLGYLNKLVNKYNHSTIVLLVKNFSMLIILL